MVNKTLSGAESTDVKLFFKDINKCTLILPKTMNYSITTIFNLPIELKQKISMELSAKDYASFRESCLEISQDIDGFSVLNSKLTSDSCPQEYENNIKRILLNQSVRMIMHRHKDEDISKVLENICVFKLKSSGGGLFISTVFSTWKMKVFSVDGVDNPYPY